MKIGSVILIILTLSLSACALLEKRDDPKVNKQLAAQANTQLGITYLREGNYEMARLKLEKALKLQPDRADTHEAMAYLYQQVGEFEKAEDHYRKSLDINPDYARGHNNYGQFLCSRGRYREAEKEFLLAANNPFYDVPSLPYTNAGRCAKRIPDLRRAELYFRKALEKDSKFPPALLQMGHVSYANGKYMSARGYLQRLQEVTEHTADSLWLAIRTEYALGDHRAWGDYAMILRNRFPDSNEVKSLKAWENERRNK